MTLVGTPNSRGGGKFYRQNLRDPLHTASLTEIHNFEIEPILRRVKNTAPGCDKLPAWLFQKCSVELADVIARLLNYLRAVGRKVLWSSACVSLSVCLSVRTVFVRKISQEPVHGSPPNLVGGSRG